MYIVGLSKDLFKCFTMVCKIVFYSKLLLVYTEMKLFVKGGYVVQSQMYWFSVRLYIRKSVSSPAFYIQSHYIPVVHQHGLNKCNSPSEMFQFPPVSKLQSAINLNATLTHKRTRKCSQTSTSSPFLQSLLIKLMQDANMGEEMLWCDQREHS